MKGGTTTELWEGGGGGLGAWATMETETTEDFNFDFFIVLVSGWQLNLTMPMVESAVHFFKLVLLCGPPSC